MILHIDVLTKPEYAGTLCDEMAHVYISEMSGGNNWGNIVTNDFAEACQAKFETTYDIHSNSAPPSLSAAIQVHPRGVSLWNEYFGTGAFATCPISREAIDGYIQSP